jgi:DNA-binding NarL/FixJ family response regulator
MTDEAQYPDSLGVLVVDDQRLMRDGIASLLEIQPGLRVLGTAASGAEAIEKALALRPDVILMDVRMPGMDGVAATRQLRQQLPSCHILMLTTFDDDEYVIDALRAGASGYLLKDIPAQDLARAVQAVHKGIYQLDPAVASKLVSALGGSSSPLSAEPPAKSPAQSGPAAEIPPSELTAREIEVLRLIAQGATNREIATQLVISEGTVKNHISHMLSRLGLRDRTQAAIYAREHGLL